MNMFKKLPCLMAMALALSSAAFPVAAQDSGPISLSGDVKAVKIFIDADGTQRTELAEPAVIVPGDRLVFGTDYANRSDQTVTNFVVTNPLPAAVRLSPDADTALEVSVDGGKTFGVVSSLSIANSDGTMRPATHADVTHVRWVLATIAPGASGRVTYPAIIR
jgi:uncharacterized repeat protein (TIGR01451 family)